MRTRTIPALSDFFPRERVARLVEGRLRCHEKGTHTTQVRVRSKQRMRLQTGALCTDYTDATIQPTDGTRPHGSARQRIAVPCDKPQSKGQLPRQPRQQLARRGEASRALQLRQAARLQQMAAALDGEQLDDRRALLHRRADDVLVKLLHVRLLRLEERCRCHEVDVVLHSGMSSCVYRMHARRGRGRGRGMAASCALMWCASHISRTGTVTRAPQAEVGRVSPVVEPCVCARARARVCARWAG